MLLGDDFVAADQPSRDARVLAALRAAPTLSICPVSPPSAFATWQISRNRRLRRLTCKSALFFQKGKSAQRNRSNRDWGSLLRKGQIHLTFDKGVECRAPLTLSAIITSENKKITSFNSDPISIADLHAARGECLERAQSGPVGFVLRALAARKLLQQRKFLRRCAEGNAVIHASRSENETLKDQVADKAAACLRYLNVCPKNTNCGLAPKCFAPFRAAARCPPKRVATGLLVASPRWRAGSNMGLPTQFRRRGPNPFRQYPVHAAP